MWRRFLISTDKNIPLPAKKLKKVKKFRLLLDAAFARPQVFARLSKKANISHVVWDFRKSGQVSDEEIYQLATTEKRFVVTINYSDFKKLIKPGRAGVIGVPSYLANEEIDKLLADFISGKDPQEFLGKAVIVHKNS